MAKEEDLRNTSGIGRAIQLVSMFLAVLWIGGTLRASAWEKEYEHLLQDDLAKCIEADLRPRDKEEQLGSQ